MRADRGGGDADEGTIAVLMLPGVGLKEDIRAARDLGAGICRIATHCTEADIAVQHFALAGSSASRPSAS